MRRGVVALLVALVLAPEAAAKGDVAVALCGASGCAQVAADAPARSALAWPHLESVPPPPVGDFFRLRFAVRGGAPRVGYYVPDAGLLALVDGGGLRTGVEGVATWTRVPPAGAAALRRALEGLEPFPAPRLTSAEIGFRPVAEPRGYLELYGVEPAGRAVPAPGDWTPIVLGADRPNPWTDGTTRLAYSPSTRQLRRGQEVVRLPEAIAAAVEARAPLAEARPRAWLGAAGGAALALVLVGLAALSVRGARRAPRRRSPAAT